MPSEKQANQQCASLPLYRVLNHSMIKHNIFSSKKSWGIVDFTASAHLPKPANHIPTPPPQQQRNLRSLTLRDSRCNRNPESFPPPSCRKAGMVRVRRQGLSHLQCQYSGDPHPSFPPQRESRARSHIQIRGAMQECSTWDRSAFLRGAASCAS